MKYRPICKNKEFSRAYARGRSYVAPQLVLYVFKNRLGHTRVGLTATKKIGGAVVRNRARRVIRAALAACLPYDVGGYDLVFVARGVTPRLKSTRLEKTVRRLLHQAGLVNGEDKTSCAGEAEPVRVLEFSTADKLAVENEGVQ